MINAGERAKRKYKGEKDTVDARNPGRSLYRARNSDDDDDDGREEMEIQNVARNKVS